MTRLRKAYAHLPAALCVGISLVATAVSAGAQERKPYGLSAIVDFIKQDIRPATILRTVRANCISFRLTPDARAAITRAGGTNELLGGLLGICFKPAAAASAQLATVSSPSTVRKPPTERAAPKSRTTNAERRTPPKADREREKGSDPGTAVAAAEANAPAKVYSLTEVDEQALPVADSGLKFDYSESLQSEDRDGDVVARFIVDTTGRIDVSSIQVRGLLGPRLTAAIESALPDVVFTPAKLQGKKVRQLTGYYISFGPGDKVLAIPVRDPALLNPIEEPVQAPKRVERVVTSDGGATMAGQRATPGLEDLAARATVFRFFEGPRSLPALGSRVYSDNFETQATRFIYVELELNFVGPSALTTYALPCAFVGPGGEIVSTTTIDGSRGPSVGTFIAVFGRGWDATGNWAPGKYEASCRYRDSTFVSAAFQVAGVTVASAFASGEENARAQQWNEAAAHYRAATELAPESPLYQFKLGQSLVKAAKPSDAERPLLRAVELAPSELSYRWELVQLLMGQSRYADVEPHFRRLVEMDAANAPLHAQLGELLVKNGKINDAIAAYETASRLASTEAYYPHRAQELRKQLPN